MNLDPITLEVWWSRLVAIADSGGSPALRVQFAGRTGQDEPFALLLLTRKEFRADSGGAGTHRLHDHSPLAGVKLVRPRRREAAGAPA